LNNPNYIPERWHGTLLIIAVATFSIIFNTLLARKLPLVEGTVLVLHIFGFFAVLVTMWVLAPRSPASEVFNAFQDNAGWGSIGLSVMLGQLAPIFSLLGSDAATHMSEELQDASYTLPRAMIWTGVVNSALGFVMLVTFMICLGYVPPPCYLGKTTDNLNRDVESVLMTPTAQPHIQVLYNATRSVTGATVLSTVIVIMAIFGCVNMVATCSRQLYAFARDEGLPFSAFLARVRPGWDLPLNSTFVSFGITVLLSLINIGCKSSSTFCRKQTHLIRSAASVAFNTIASMGTAAILSSYAISISCMFLKRWRKETLLPSKFSLGKAGIWVNGMAVLWLLNAIVFAFFPTYPHPTPNLFNWNVLIYGVVVIVSLAWFYAKARKVYVGPVQYLNKDA
jgi:choline transport protein